MKNACVVLRNHINISWDDGVQAVIDELFLGGYTMNEVRFLSLSNIENTKKSLLQLTAEYENIFVTVERSLLSHATQCLPQNVLQSQPLAGFGGAGIYHCEKSDVFLLSCDRTETGCGYVKNACVPFLQKKYGLRFDKIVIRCIGSNASHTQQLLAEAKRRGEGKIACVHMRKYDEDIIEIVYDNNTPKMLADDLLRWFAEGFEDTMYALENVSIERQLVSLLKVRGKKLSVAESFTGGGVAKRIVSVSGASEVYFEGVNTYHERSKIKRLGVSSYTLGAMGAVSEKTAYEMALGLLNTGDCDVAIATTGLAGPKSDRTSLPVGLCYIAVGTKERICVYQYKFDGSREEITEKAINYALFLTYKQLKNNM